MAFEIPDSQRSGKLITCLGVSMQNGREHAPQVVRIWQSGDSGKTWDKSLNPDTAGWIDVDGFFGNTIQLPDGALVSVYSCRGAAEKTHIEDTLERSCWTTITLFPPTDTTNLAQRC